MSKQSNLAYDLSRYEYQAPKQEPKREQVIKERKVQAKSFSTFRTIVAIFFAGSLMCAVLYGKAEETTLQAQIAALDKQVDIEYSDNVRMKTEIEGRTSLENVEDYAENVLGLRKLDKSQIEYVQLQKDNVVEISKSESNLFVDIKNKFYEIVEYLEG